MGWQDEWLWCSDEEYLCDSCGWAGDVPRFIENEYEESACVCPMCGYIIEI